MSAKHTKGPWIVEQGHVQRDSGGIRYWQITDGQDAIACNQFCYAGHDPETNLANARLIAAAPDLLSVMLDIFENEGFDVAIGGNPIMVEALMKRGYAAIAKARGAA